MAEVDNEMVKSPQYEEMKVRMYEGALREAIIKNETAIRKARETASHAEILKDIKTNVPYDDR